MAKKKEQEQSLFKNGNTDLTNYYSNLISQLPKSQVDEAIEDGDEEELYPINNSQPQVTEAPVTQPEVVDFDGKLTSLKKDVADIEYYEKNGGVSPLELDKAGQIKAIRAGGDAVAQWDWKGAEDIYDRADDLEFASSASAAASRATQKVEDANTREKIAIKENEYNQNLRNGVSEDDPSMIAIQDEINILSSKLRYSLGYGSDTELRKNTEKDEDQELANSKEATAIEKSAFTNAKDMVTKTATKINGAASQMGKAFTLLQTVADDPSNATAAAAALKTFLQSIDNSVVMANEYEIMQNPSLVNRVGGLLRGLIAGQKMTVSDLQNVWNAAISMSEAINAVADGLADKAVEFYEARLEGENVKAKNKSLMMLGNFYDVNIPTGMPEFKDVSWGDIKKKTGKSTDGNASIIDTMKADWEKMNIIEFVSKYGASAVTQMKELLNGKSDPKPKPKPKPKPTSGTPSLNDLLEGL